MTSHDGSWGVLGNRSAPFSFFPKGALTHHRAAGPAVVLPRCVRRALCEADCALFGERQTMPPCLRAAVAIVCAEGAVRLSLRLRKPAPSSFIAEAGHHKSLACFLFCERETEKGNTEVIATGNISFGSESHQQRHRPIRMRSIGIYELFRHL